eukprot:4561983-Lingulodinium_polyedra.AAC.1
MAQAHRAPSKPQRRGLREGSRRRLSAGATAAGAQGVRWRSWGRGRPYPPPGAPGVRGPLPRRQW